MENYNKRFMKKTMASVGMLASLLFYFPGCNDHKTEEEGYQLAKKHCQSCHQFPDPGALDKKTWSAYVLPKMGDFLGFSRFESGSYYENGRKPDAMPLNDWFKIVRYYLEKAPEALPHPEGKKKIAVGLKDFDIMLPSFSLKDPATTCVGILPKRRQMFFADGLSQQLYLLSEKGAALDSFKLGEGVVNIQMTGPDLHALAMGVLYPSDDKRGSLAVQDMRTRSTHILLDSLQRPVHAAYADLNQDSLEDIVVSEFGNLSGQLAWFENRGNGKYLKHTLRPLPGAVCARIVDVDKDGRPDIMVLMAQGDEGIFIYYNKGGGRFEEERVLQFPPTYGSNYFELDDFNKDGYPDILATNGDNGDYPPILKPYHGIRIYMNDGRNHFKEKIFLPVNGACKAIAADFDGDGDLDIASISYFPDYDHTPEESFIYWEDLGDLSFQPFSFPEALAGRWLTMETGDIDQDGAMDIILGNAKFTLGYVPDWLMKKWNSSSPSVIVLKNKTKRSSPLH
jgi:hypothetical protein